MLGLVLLGALRSGNRSTARASEVQLAVAVVGLALLWVFWQMLRTGVVVLSSSEARMDPRERAMLTLIQLRRHLMDAGEVTLDPSGLAIDISSSKGQGRIRWERDRSELRLEVQPPGAAGSIVTRGVTDFRVEALGPGLVHMVLVLRRPPAGGRLPEPVPLRIEEDVFIPVLGRRNDTIPWHDSADRA